jgi:hypothetical protein
MSDRLNPEETEIANRLFAERLDQEPALTADDLFILKRADGNLVAKTLDELVATGDLVAGAHGKTVALRPHTIARPVASGGGA